MAYAKKTAKNEAYQKLKTDLKEGNPLGNAYLFYGEESYLREYYLGEIRKALIPAGFEEFNYHALEGKDLTAQSLTEMAEAMPMMAERTLIVVTDWDGQSIFISVRAASFFPENAELTQTPTVTPLIVAESPISYACPAETNPLH